MRARHRINSATSDIEAEDLDRFIIDLTSELVRAPAIELAVLREGLARLARLIRVERIVLWELSLDGASVLLRYADSPSAGESMPDFIPAIQFGWLMEQNRQAQIVVWPRVPEDIPAAAVGEREYALRIGAKSMLSIPVYSHSVLCALAFTCLSRSRSWSQPVLDRLQLASTIFAGAAVRQRLDASLRASEARNRAILQALPDLMVVLSPDGTYLDYHCRDESTLLIPPEKFIGGRLSDFFPPEMHVPVGQALARAAASGELVELEYAFTLNGRHRVHEARMIRRDDGAIVCLVRDISERSCMLRELCESEERFRGAFENSAIGMAIVSPDGRWLRSNPANCRILGYTEAELREQSFRNLTHPEDVDLNMEEYRRALNGEIDHYQMKKRYIHRDGHVVHGYLTVSVVRDERGTPLYFVSQLQDRTESIRERSEIERLRAELMHSGRVALMGQLTASLAHQLMQPLAAMQANAEACQRLLSEPHPALADTRRALQDIVSSCTRAACIVANVKGLLRKQPVVRREVSVNALLKEILEVVRHDLAARHIRLLTRFDRGAPCVVANPIELQQVFLNLVLNAAEALEQQPSSREILIGTLRRADRRVEVFVHDSGPGVPEADLKRIFDPFFTTKDQGMGMGLAICRDIVLAHGGLITAEPAAKGGFRVCCSFPPAIDPHAT